MQGFVLRSLCILSIHLLHNHHQIFTSNSENVTLKSEIVTHLSELFTLRSEEVTLKYENVTAFVTPESEVVTLESEVVTFELPLILVCICTSLLQDNLNVNILHHHTCKSCSL